MADLKISELSALAGSNLVAADALAIVDDSASETKKITVSDLIANGVTVISDDTIPGAKILFGAGDIATAALADAAVTTAKVADDAITAAKLGNESTVDLVTTLPGAGAFTGQLAFDTDDNKLYVWDGSAWQSLKAAGSVNTVSGSTTGEINIVSSVSGDTVTLTATIDNTSSANQFLAGPTGAAGAVGYRVIDGSDLPVSTSSAKGGVIVNGEGLRMDANTIEVNNDVTASSTHHVVTYDAKGLITGGRVLAASDLPIATASAVGGVIASTGLTVDGSGNLTINNTVTADTYTKVTVAATGLVTAGSNLAASDLPNHSADLLTSGNIPLARIADNLVTGAKLADYASAKIGETNPTADYIGQLFFNPLTRDLSLWDGNVFQPIGISAGEIVFAGTYNATTNLLSSVTSDGTGAGYVVGQALPAASNTNKNFYVVVDVGGTGTSPAPAVSLAPPDFVLSTGTEYKLIDVSETVTAQVASNVGFTPVGTIAANNVQTALAEVDTEKLAKSGGTMTGNLELNDANVVFEGSTENAFETTLTVVDPTADRTITLPNVTGAVVTTGDTGTVTSTMLTDGTIVNADINASAEIAVSKLANGTARQLLQTDAGGTGVEFTSNVDVPGTLDVTGAATLDSTLGVAGLISANGKVSFPLGSAAAPSLLPGADTNTGIFSPGADQLAITTAGTQRVTVDSSGKVGVGTSSPSDNGSDTILAVKRNASGESASIAIHAASNAASLIRFADGTSTAAERNAGSLRVDHSTGSMQFSLQDSEKVRIDSSGNVFIGGTAAASADIALNANGSATFAGNVLSGDLSSSGVQIQQNGQINIRKDSGDAVSVYNGGLATSNQVASIGSDGSATFNTGSTFAGICGGSAGIYVGDSTTTNQGNAKARINSDGSASFSSDISIHHASTSTGSGKGIKFITDGGVVGRTRGQIDINQTAGNGGDLLFSTTADGASSPTERLRIDSSGNVGIGETSMDALLVIKGNSDQNTTPSIRLKDGSDTREAWITNTAGDLVLANGGNDNVPHCVLKMFDGNIMTFSTANTERMRIDSSGRLCLGTTSSGGVLSNFTLNSDDNYNSTSDVPNSTVGLRLFNTNGADGGGVANTVSMQMYVGSGATSAGSLAYIRTADNVGAFAFNHRTAASSYGESMRITSSGNVGIGTTSPSYKLEVKNDNSYGMRVGGDGGGAYYLELGQSSTNGAPGINYTGTNASLKISNNGSEIARFDGSGNLIVGNTSATGFVSSSSQTGVIAFQSGALAVNNSNDDVVSFNRLVSDGTIVSIRQGGTQEGEIRVSGTTVSYIGGHLSRWSQTLTLEEHSNLPKGTVMTNLDEMCEWENEGNEQLNKMAISTTEGDPNVAGVIVGIDEDNDLNVAMTGDMVIRIAQGTTVARGDLLMSAGDGTAKPQDDDIVRSKTIAKVTSTTVSETYSDNSYCVPCVLMAC